MATIIYEDTVWGKGDVINLTDDVQIASGATLTVKPGAKIYGNDHEIMAFGELIVGRQGSSKSVKIFDADIGLGQDYRYDGRIEISNVMMSEGSLLGSYGYGSFSVTGSVFNSVDGFYVWYPDADSEFVGNIFSKSDGMSIGTSDGISVLVRGNYFYEAERAINGQSTIVSWASYDDDKSIKIINNTFVGGPAYVLELPEGYSSAALFANGNYIAASNGDDGESFVLDSQDSLTRAADISLGDQATKSTFQGPLYLFGDSGGDTIDGSRWDDQILGRGGDDTIFGRSGADALSGGDGRDNLLGGSGTDNLKGGGGSDVLLGGGQDDHLDGGSRGDILQGGGGDDTLIGGAGFDLLQGQKGNDILSGGSRRDVFYFNRGDGHDIVTDFELGIDHIQIGNGASRLGQLDFQQVGDDVLLSFRNVAITVENTTVDEFAVRDNFLFV